MRTTLGAFLVAATLHAAGAAAQAYPAKPIRLMVPFPPGGSTDIVARIVAHKLSSQLGQQLVVENRGGAGGTLGTATVAKAAPDGYMLTVGTTSTHVVAPSVYTKLEYDPVKDFAPNSLVAVTPYLLVVNPSVAAKTVKELVELMRSQPGKLNYASAGVGSTTHLAMEMLKTASGTYALHIPYNGNGPAGTPAPVIDRLHKEIGAAIASPETREALNKAGAEPVSSSPAELAAMIRDGVEKYAKVVKIAGVKPE